jgi:hypothetical protein
MKKLQNQVDKSQILEMVEQALKMISDEFDELPKDHPNVKLLLDLKEKAKRNDYMGIIETGVMKFKDKPITIGVTGKRPSFQDKLDAESVEWAIAQYSSLFDKSKPVKKYRDKKELEKRINELKKVLEQGTHKELIDITAEYLVEHEKAAQIILAQQNHIDFLQKKLLDTRTKTIKAVANRAIGKERTYKSNNDCLKYCYQGFANSLERPVRGSDYPAYKRFLLKLYKYPPFVPRVRLTTEEKRKSKQNQSEDRELKQKYDWKDATVRAAFEKYSGLKATTLKK